jgi:hypothetical protein
MAFLGHHAATFTLAILSQAPYANFYGFFFFGAAMVSSIPLAIVEMTKFVEAPLVHQAARIAFAGAFLTLRTVVWPILSARPALIPPSVAHSYDHSWPQARFWLDSFGLLRSPAGPHSWFAVLFFLVSNLGLTSLQFLWTSKIVAGLSKALAPPRRKKASA